jgi:hypothetical protein
LKPASSLSQFDSFYLKPACTDLKLDINLIVLIHFLDPDFILLVYNFINKSLIITPASIVTQDICDISSPPAMPSTYEVPDVCLPCCLVCNATIALSPALLVVGSLLPIS